jgi:hypothetical protein
MDLRDTLRSQKSGRLDSLSLWNPEESQAIHKNRRFDALRDKKPENKALPSYRYNGNY